MYVEILVSTDIINNILFGNLYHRAFRHLVSMLGNKKDYCIQFKGVVEALPTNLSWTAIFYESKLHYNFTWSMKKDKLFKPTLKYITITLLCNYKILGDKAQLSSKCWFFAVSTSNPRCSHSLSKQAKHRALSVIGSIVWIWIIQRRQNTTA